MVDLGNAGTIIDAALFAGSAYVGVSRFRGKLESNVPLFYYLALVAFGIANPLVINPYVLYVAVIAGLLLRFEFMNQKVISVVRLVESACLIFIGLRLAQVLVYGY
jgi:hypothetical protein